MSTGNIISYHQKQNGWKNFKAKMDKLSTILDIWQLSQESSYNLRGEKLNYKSVAKEISKPPFLAPEVQWVSKLTVFVRFTFPLDVSNQAHIWYVT